MLKLISWNVNGIRAVLGKGFAEYIKKEDPDILCLQETKAHSEQVDVQLKQYEHHFWNSANKKGYSGTAIFSKIKPLSVKYGINHKDHDSEGRVITAEFEKFYLITVYTPNSKRELLRLKYRQEWDKEFLSYVKNLEKNKPVVFCGDLNVAHKEIDLEHPKSNRKNAGFTDEERADFDKILEARFIDSYRFFYPNEAKKYTWWSYMFHARAKNIGWRIDYFVVSENLKNKLKAAFIRDKIIGSDHCPVGIMLDVD